MRKIVFITFVLFVLAAGVFLLRPSSQSADKKEDVTAAQLLTYSPAGPAKNARPEGLNAPTNISNSIPSMAETKATPELMAELESFKKAFETADYGLTGIRSNLVEELKSDPAKMPMVVDWLKSQTNADFTASLAELISQTCGQAGNALLEKTALDLTKDSSSPAHRNTGLSILSTITEPDHDVLQTAGMVATSDDDLKNRASAIDALGKWMIQSKDAEMQGNMASQLVAAANAPGADEKLRGHAFQCLANQQEQLSLETLQTMPNLLQQQSDPQIRGLAATVLGQAADDAKGYAMNQLEQGLVAETDADTKRIIASQIVRLGKNDGLEQVRQLAGNDPDLVQQMEGYLEMIKHNAHQ